MMERYIKSDMGDGYFVYSARCFALPMNDVQRIHRVNMEHSVRRFMIAALSDRIMSRTDEREIARIEFLLDRMKGELKTVGAVGSRDLVIGYVLLDDQDTIMHRMLFD